MASTESDTYCQRLYDLFEKHHPGQYSKDYVNVILEQNKDRTHEFYEEQCKAMNETALPPITSKTDKTDKGDTKESKKEKEKRAKKKQKKKKKKQKKKAQAKLHALLNDGDGDGDKKKNVLKIPSRRPEPRKSIIGMIRMNVAQNKAKGKDSEKDKQENQSVIETESHNISVAVRIRPVNEKEKRIEHRLLFRHEFDFDDKEYDYFLEQRQELINKYPNVDDFKRLTVDEICDWLETIKLESYRKRFRRRKVNGDWIYEFPKFNEKKPLEVDENAIIAFTKGNKSKRYDMDYVLKSITTQDQTFKTLGVDVVENIIKGYNCTVFAFGQTGTGKTHTMFGWHQEEQIEETNDNGNKNKDEDEDEEDDGYTITFTEEELNRHKTKKEDKNKYSINEEIDGLIPRILNELFVKLDSDPDIAFFNISCGFIEIYQEKLRDLIRPRLKIQLRYIGMGSELINLSWHEIQSYRDLAKLIETANKHRVTASTLQNSTSSRSHCIIQLKVEITLVDGTNQCNKISFGDLAGSEKLTKTGATGQRMNEAKKIVKSLFSLKKVIRALSEKKAFVPYQDSVLTKLLRDSLGGNSLTTIICCISPHAYNREETLSTLRFAEMAKKIKNEAIVNRIISRKEMETQINSLREQLSYLKKQKANKRNRFNSTDFRVLQSQLMDASKKAEEYTQKYLQSEIQLLMKTSYTNELEGLLSQKNEEIEFYKNQLIKLKEDKMNIDDIDITKFEKAKDDQEDDEKKDDQKDD